MKHFNLFYILGVINFRYDATTATFTCREVSTIRKLCVHLILPNGVLLYIVLIGKSNILLSISSVQGVVFYGRIMTTVATMNIGLLLNYLHSSATQVKLLNDCLASIKNSERYMLRRKISPFYGSIIVLVLFTSHYTNYELNQYTYVELYAEELPELTFYVVFYFTEMVTVMTALYYACVLAVIRRSVQLDCEDLETSRRDCSRCCSPVNTHRHCWRTNECYFNRVHCLIERKRAFCCAFELQLLVITLNTFLVSFSIFYVNLNKVLLSTHDDWLQIYCRVTESMGFFSLLGALLLICYHTSNLHEEYVMDAVNYKNLMMKGMESIAPLGLFNLDMNFYFSTLAAIVTYLVILMQFREFEYSQSEMH
ncbi:uncharacterized protein LOC131215637 [Anopheles bellator]|uniref:uncharacterized protein LOC131215637 n=1 Tax=Anopheles bellator TaxID=139047 RepID=UPI0026474392|nr:uncharacterized protein LOC131215637 [Anopheles bellator]